MLKTVLELKQQRVSVWEKAKALNATAIREKRDLSPEEQKEFDRLLGELDRLSGEIHGEYRKLDLEQHEKLINAPGVPLAGKPSPGGSRAAGIVEPGEIRVLTPERRMAEHGAFSNDPEERNLDFGKFLRGVVTGRWSGAEDERRAMAVGTLAGGGALVPEMLSLSVIDLARNKARLFEAGALTVPMEGGNLSIARVAGDPTAGWKAENAAATPSNMTMERIKFETRTLVAIVKASVELFEDAPNVGRVVSGALAEGLTLELDRVGLRGNGMQSEPLGIRNQSGVTVTDLGTNGLALVDFDKFIDGVQVIEEANGEAGAVIYAPRTSASLAKLKDQQNQPLMAPDVFKNLKKFVTNQVPINLTHGSAGNASEAYIGGFENVMFGLMTRLVLEVSREAADSDSSAFRNLQVWIRAYLRADVGLVHPNQLVVLDGIIP